MKRLLPLSLVAALGAVAPVPAFAAPGEMSVGTFLAKADALKARGIMALGSSDIGLLKTEGQAAGQAYRARLTAERAAGKPSSCPPKGTKVGSAAMIAHLRGYPPAARGGTTMETAIADYFIKTYPCR